MLTIRLWGELGDRFAEELQLEVHTLKEAIQGLFCNFPELRPYIIEQDMVTGQQYKVTAIGAKWERQLTETDVDFPLRDAILVIVPVITGSGFVGKLIGGLALIGIGIATGGLGLVIAGASMFLQAAFAGKSKAPTGENDPRSAFINGGNLNTAEGNTIPIVCGLYRMKSGAGEGAPQVISFYIKSEYQAR